MPTTSASSVLQQGDVFAKPRLDDTQVRFFQEQGYLLYHKPVLPAAKFAGLQNCFEGLLTRWLADPRMASPEHMDTPHFIHPELFAWLFDDAILDLIEPILGPDIALFSSHFICKPAARGKRVPWHEDSFYWKGYFDPFQVVTVWLALDPSTPANGCMRVVPGSHRTGRRGFSDYEVKQDASNLVFSEEIVALQRDDSKAVDCVLKPNEASLHDSLLIHGSNANLGAQRRCGYTMRYFSTRTRMFLDKARGGFQVYLARGRDHAGNCYGDPTKPNDAWLKQHTDAWPVGH